MTTAIAVKPRLYWDAGCQTWFVRWPADWYGHPFVILTYLQKLRRCNPSH
jgi:hypothetical protein